MLLTLKSGAGLATLPVHIGDYDADLVRVLHPIPELMSQISLLAHPDLLKTPRVRAFFDFVTDAIEPLRPMLLGRTD
jgi:DNA-binding transcriptional LysR family regulator